MRKKMLQLIAIVVATTPFVAIATTVVNMNLEELTRRSDTAVIAKVTSVSYGFNEEAGYPETRTKFSVEDTVYGGGNREEIILSLPGGPIGDGLVTVVPGMPRFKDEERVVLFAVEDNDRGFAYPTGLEQGVFRIRTDPKTKIDYVFNQAMNLGSIELSPTPLKRQGNESKSRLREFEIEVKRLAKKVKK